MQQDEYTTRKSVSYTHLANDSQVLPVHKMETGLKNFSIRNTAGENTTSTEITQNVGLFQQQMQSIFQNWFLLLLHYMCNRVIDSINIVLYLHT